MTLQPIRRYDMDASIIFSDILVIPQAMGMECKMVPGKGPTFVSPLKLEDLNDNDTTINLRPDIKTRLSYVYEAVTLTRQRLEGKVPLIGFAGAPWTLMGYMIEGSGSKTYSASKKWLYQNDKEANILLDALTENVIDHLVAQAEAGAQMLQVFESNAGHLSAHIFEKYCTPRLKRIATSVKSRLGKHAVPMTIFAKDGHFALESFSNSDYDVIGVDWCTPPELAREKVGNKVLQGNLDPCALYAPEEKLAKIVLEMVNRFSTDKYIVNLGHGIYPDMSPDSVKTFIKTVHSVQID